MSQSWAEALLFICVVAQFFCVTASVDLGVADDVRVLARPAPYPAIRSGARSRRIASRGTPSGRSSSWPACLMVPAIWNYLVGYGVGTAIAVIGLYIAFVIPVISAVP